MRCRIMIHKVHIIVAILIISVLTSFLPAISVHASEYHSWMREGEDLYGDVGTASDSSAYSVIEPKDDSVVKHFVNLINSGTYAVDESLNKPSTKNYKLNMDGIVMGRLAGFEISILKFELFKNNPWGIVGSYVYVAFRNLIYGLMFLYVGMLLVKQLFGGGAKGRAELKSTSGTVLFIFSLLYIMPWIANMFVIGRDGMILKIGERLLGVRGHDIQSSVSAVMQMSDEVDIFLALVYFALMIAPIFYVIGYASIALQETGLFGAFPVVAILSIRDKRLLSTWSGMFFSNLAVPLLDYVFLLLPIVLKILIEPEGGENVAYAIVTLCCIWAAQPARNTILRVFGNMGGAQANIGGMAALGMAAMRMMGGGFGKGGSGSGNGSSVTDDLTNAQRFENLSGGFNEALADTQREVDKIASIDDINREFSAFGGIDEDGMSITSLADGNVEGDVSSANPADVDLIPGGGVPGTSDVDMPMEGEAELIPEYAQSSVSEEPLGDAELASGETTGEGLMPTETISAESMPTEGMKDEASADMSATTTMDSDNDAFYKRGEIPSEQLSQRQVFQNARLDNLEKLDAAKNALNTQQLKVDEAERDYANVAGDVAEKEKTFADNTARLNQIDTDIKNDSAYIQKYDELNQRYDSMSPAEKQNFDSTYADIETRRSNLSNLQNEQATLTAQNATLTNEINKIKENPAYVKAEQALTTAKSKRDAYAGVIQQRTDAEKAYATMMRDQGGNYREYENANSYRNSIKAIDTRKNQTSWRNFDAHASADILSPDEIAGYYRQRAEHKQVQQAVSTAAKIAGGFAGAVGGMYGGVGAMATGGMLGSGLAGSAADKGIEHYHDRQDYKQAKAAGQTEAPVVKGNKYENYVERKKKARTTQNQTQNTSLKETTAAKSGIDTVTSFEGVREQILEDDEKFRANKKTDA